MAEEAHDPKVPDADAAAKAERSHRIVGKSEELIESLDLDAEARREFEEAREEHAARVAGPAKATRRGWSKRACATAGGWADRGEQPRPGEPPARGRIRSDGLKRR